MAWLEGEDRVRRLVCRALSQGRLVGFGYETNGDEANPIHGFRRGTVQQTIAI